MPHEYISDSVCLQLSFDNTRSPVIGQNPPLASVAAMTASDSQFTSIEHSWK
jgi:hypothetical protein